MAREEHDVRTRLQNAALKLFQERGYDGTTASEIAAVAGVTERTFFRYFADKREVLFDGEEGVRAALTTAIAEAPAELGALDTLLRAFRSFQPALENRQAYLQTRHAIIAGAPALNERELAKLAALTDALADALKARGVEDLRAVLAAHVGMVAFVQATFAWLQEPKVSFGKRVDRAARELKALLEESA